MNADGSIILSLAGQHGDASVEIDVVRGGRVGQITVGGVALLIDPPESAERDATSTGWGSYPMAPWAGRIRHGNFTFLSERHELRLNQDDSGGTDASGARRHAMHGTVFISEWTVEEQHDTALTMRCELAQPESGWTLGGLARQRIELLDGQLRCDLSVETDHPSGSSFPAELGWHPWWKKPNSLGFHPDAMYERDEIGLPTGRLVAPGAGPWDDCFVNSAPVTLHYDRDVASNITLSSDCDHWVIYDMPADATCVEPQSGPPDAVNIRPRLVTPSHPLRRTMNVAW